MIEYKHVHVKMYMHGHFNLLLTDNCQLKTYYSQEKEQSSTLSFSSFVSDKKKKEIDEKMMKRIAAKNKKKEIKEEIYRQILTTLVLNTQTNISFVYLYIHRYVYHT